MGAAVPRRLVLRNVGVSTDDCRPVLLVNVRWFVVLFGLGVVWRCEGWCRGGRVARCLSGCWLS